MECEVNSKDRLFCIERKRVLVSNADKRESNGGKRYKESSIFGVGGKKSFLLKMSII